jgi:hypothetical protein
VGEFVNGPRAAHTLAGRIGEKCIGGTGNVSVGVQDDTGTLCRAGLLLLKPFKEVGDTLGG